MKILNSDFSDKGKEWFESLTRTKQKKWLRDHNKLSTDKQIQKALKGVKYGRKSKSTKKKTSKSKSKQASK